MTDSEKLIIEELLPYINKPGRFIGNEIGAICHPWEGRVSIALAYPDLYELGMSNLGLAILYNIINNSPRGRAERVFAVSDDVAEVMRLKAIPLFSLESKTPLNKFQILGFNSATELNYTNILSMLALAGIPLLSSDRGENDPLVAIGGGCAFNPEPLGDFADFFFLGDAEEAILEIMAVMDQYQTLPRIDKLARLSGIEGVYVPGFYQEQYSEEGHYLGLKPLRGEAPAKIRARTVKELKNSYYPQIPIVPAVEIAHDRLSIEIMRGCGHACRFCQATVIYKPARMRNLDDIISQAIINIEKSGYDEITLLSLSSGDYKDIEILAKRLVEKMSGKHVEISLPSLRISGLSLELAKIITENKKTGLTFAPEAGTERLRLIINKPVEEDTLIAVLGEAFRQDWQTIKLYFMIGLPTETEEDLQGIAELVGRLSRLSDRFRGRRTFNITISTFCPKSHTPWQWERQISIDETHQKAEFLRRAIRSKNTNLKFHSPEITWLEGILGRGDRRLGRAILKAYRLGAHMDGWSEHFQFEIWKQAFAIEGIQPESYLGERSTGKPLPWDHIEKGLSRESLLKELARSRGLTEAITSLDRDKVQPLKPEKPAIPDSSNQISYGRTPKTLKASPSLAVPQSRLRIRWGRGGLARFLSHLDNMKALERAFRRAGLPIAFSMGFRPRPKFSFGPSLTLGFTSEAEYLDVQLEAPLQQYMLNSLGRAFPPDFRLLGSRTIPGKAQSLSSQLNLAIYEVELPFPLAWVKERIDRILGGNEFKIFREIKSGPIEVEVRKSILGLSAIAGTAGKVILTMQTGMADLGFIKPYELLRYGFEILPEQLPALPIHRKNLARMEQGRLIDPFELG